MARVMGRASLFVAAICPGRLVDAPLMLVMAYDPPLRPRRIAPPSLRAAPAAVEAQLTLFARDLDRTER